MSKVHCVWLVQHFLKILSILGASMYFWLVSLTNQLSGQFLIIFARPKKKLSSLRDRFFFVHPLVFLFSLCHQRVTKNENWLDKKYQGVDKKNCPVSETWQFHFGQSRKNENWMDNWSVKETDQKYMDALIELE